MKVNELLDLFLTGEDLNNILNIKKYIEIEDKRNIALEVLTNCSNIDGGYLHLDHFKKYIYFIVAVGREYADIEFDRSFDNILDEYNALCRCGIIKELIDIVLDDFKISEKVLECEEKNMIGKYSLEVKVSKIVDDINESLELFLHTIGDKIEGCDIASFLPEGTDIDKLLKMLDKLNIK